MTQKINEELSCLIDKATAGDKDAPKTIFQNIYGIPDTLYCKKHIGGHGYDKDHPHAEYLKYKCWYLEYWESSFSTSGTPIFYSIKTLVLTMNLTAMKEL